MKSIVNAKKKNSRRYGQNLWGDANSPILKRNYAPGQHGQRRKKTTDYGEQLYAKQRLKVYYGNISEKQFHKYYEEAIRRRGDAAENLIGLLESRLDNLVYKAVVLSAVQSQSRDFPSYLEVDAAKLSAKYSFVPKFDDVPYAAQMEPNLVIEFYSR